MDFGQIFESFSRRKEAPEQGMKSLTPEFRNRILMLCVERHGIALPYSDGPPAFWSRMHQCLRYLHGRSSLASTREFSVVDDSVVFLGECNDEHFLDFVEFIFSIQDSLRSSSTQQVSVAEVNVFFDADNLPYYLTDFVYTYGNDNVPLLYGSPTNATATVRTLERYPQVICRPNEVLHQTAIEPTLNLLRKPKFKYANQEFLEGLKEFRKGEYGDCVTKCASAFESVMKIICAEKGISYSGGGEGTKLLNAIRPKTSLDGFYKSSLQIAFVIRNEYSTVHGAGTKPRTVSKHVANFVINSVAGAIQLLVDEMKV